MSADRGMPQFGVAGNPPNFWASDFRKDRLNAPAWLASIGLDALEIQCTYGVRMPDEKADSMRENATRFGIELSIHAPYYISLGSPNPASIERSLNEIGKAVRLAKRLGSTRVIFHPGGAGSDRTASLRRVISALARFEGEADLGDVRLFPEIAGKRGQLGSLDEILAICAAVDCAWPCLDLAHLHAREAGSLRSATDFHRIFDELETRLGCDALKYLHVHFYPVEWGPGGEVEHRAFADVRTVDSQLSLFAAESSVAEFYFPRFEPFIEVVHERRLTPRVICEAKDSQDIGALAMKEYFASLAEGRGNRLRIG